MISQPLTVNEQQPRRRHTSILNTSTDNHVGRILLGEPGSLFVLNRSSIHEFVEHLWQFDNDPFIRVITIQSANHEVFCIGGDLREMRKIATTQSAPTRPGVYDALSVGEALYSAHTPVLTQVGGLAAGGGLELVLASDIVVCSDTACFAVPEALRGTGGLVLAQLLGRLVPRRVAFDMLYSGRTVDAQEALRLHLVNEVASDDKIGSITQRWIDIIVDRAPLTMSAHRVSMNYLLDLPLAMGTRTPVLPDPYTSADMRRGIDAFFAKTAPAWEGQ